MSRFTTVALTLSVALLSAASFSTVAQAAAKKPMHHAATTHMAKPGKAAPAASADRSADQLNAQSLARSQAPQ